MLKLFILSNPVDEWAKTEDDMLATLFMQYFQVQVLDLFDDVVFDQEGPFLVRNIWGSPGIRERMVKIYQHFGERNIFYSNTFDGIGDQQGKQHLIDLYEAYYPVIPSFDQPQKALMHGAEEYLLKPIYGGSSEGILEFSHADLPPVDATGYIIQPKLTFEHEVSFFFVDKIFQHALITRHSRWDLELYTASQDEIKIAQQFANWNSMKRGIQRIDFIKTQEGQLLLLEVEDWCPYLSLHLLGDQQAPFVNTLAKSLL